MTPTSTPRRLTRSAVAALAAAGLLAAGTAPAAAETANRSGSKSFSYTDAPKVAGKITASATYQQNGGWLRATNSWNNPRAVVTRTSGSAVYAAKADLTFKLNGIAISVTVGYPSLSDGGSYCVDSFVTNSSKVDVALSGKVCNGSSYVAITGGSYIVGGYLRPSTSAWRGSKLTLNV